MNWLASLYCTHHELTGQPCVEYESHCRPTGQLCIVSIFDWLAVLVLYPSLTDWPVLYCTHLRLAGQPLDVTLCYVRVMWWIESIVDWLACIWLIYIWNLSSINWLAQEHNPKLWLYKIIYHLASFFKEISNLIITTSDIACTMHYIKMMQNRNGTIV